MLDRLAIRLALASVAAMGPLPTVAQAPPDTDGGADGALRVAPLSLAPPDATDLSNGLSALETALALSREERFAEAADGFLALLDYLPTLGDWVPVFAAEQRAELGDTTAVRLLLEQLPAESAVRRGWGWWVDARAHEVADDAKGALAIAQAAALDEAPGPPGSLPWYRVGELALATGDTAVARRSLSMAMRVGGADRWAVRAADLFDGIRGPTARERYRVARTRVAQGEIARAIEGLELWGEVDGLSAEETAQSRLDLARGYFTARRYGLAERTARALLDQGTAGDAYLARALYWVGRAQYRQGKRDQGRATLESVGERFPGVRAAGDALYVLADLDHDADRLSDARDYYHRILDVVPASGRADVAGIRVGSMDYLEASYGDAARLFDRRRVEAGSRSARQQAAFWSGLSYEALGLPDSAAARFLEAYESDPLSYYGAQAATRLRAPLLAEGLPAGPLDDEGVRAGELVNAVARLRVHLRVPTPGSFAWELGRVKRHFSVTEAHSYALAEALIGGGLPIQGIVLGREIQRRTAGWNLRLLRIIYPFPHRDLIVREAERRGVNPYLAAAIIRQESMFDEDIVSRAGAIGMMQVMPGTGREVARSLGISPFSAARLTEAEVNVPIGMSFLSEMLRRYDGNVLDALVAYNAGPTRIRRWRAYPEYGDRDVFTERIPFRETRHYVKIVQQNAVIYETLYGCGSEDVCLGEPPGPVRGLSPQPGSSQSTQR